MRQPKPFFRSQNNTWYVQLVKRQINLGRNKSEAWAKYHELMAADIELNYFSATVVQLLDVYLDWCQKRRSEATFESAQHFCKSFVACIGKRLTVRQLNPKHITAWMDLHPKWRNTSKYDAISVIQRAFNWAIKQGHIDRSPIAYIEDKPRPTRREVVYSPVQFKTVLTTCGDDLFRHFLEFMWETGCRPIEVRVIERVHIDLDKNMIVLPASLNKTRKGPRVIFLNDRAADILTNQVEIAEQVGPIFRNSRGNPWTKDAVKCRLQRIKAKLGIDRLCAYGIRHSFATEGLKNNVDPLSLSVLMGHSDVSMIARTYQHLARNPEYLLEQANKATGA